MAIQSHAKENLMPTPRIDVTTIAATHRDIRVAEPLSLLNDMTWAEGAAPSCAQTDPEAFYPEQGGRQHVQAAKTVCASCPVRAKCLQHALETSEQWGVWGGLTPGERRRLKRATEAGDDSSAAA